MQTKSFHLKSAGGRWEPSLNSGTGGWNTSDTEYGRNLGAFGNTKFASKMDTFYYGSFNLAIVETGVGLISGAKWRLRDYDDETTWRDNNTSVYNLVPGTYVIVYKDISGWIEPGSKTDTLSPGVHEAWGEDRFERE